MLHWIDDDLQKFDVEALRLVRKMHADDNIITVPNVHLFDEDAHVMIIDDCGMTLALPQTVAEEIGIAIATTKGAGRSRAWITYGRLISTLSGTDDVAALADPGLDIPEKKLAVISKLAETRSHEIGSTIEVMTHGDFWPGNIMVSLRRESEGGMPRLEKLYVLDWELARGGLRGLDIGQFCAEMQLLQRFYPSRQEEAFTIMRSFLLTYRGGSGPDEALARVAIAHVGAHLVTWTARVDWGDREVTRKMKFKHLNVPSSMCEVPSQVDGRFRLGGPWDLACMNIINDTNLAVKLEHLTDNSLSLEHEYHILKQLKGDQLYGTDA
ncbi:hypothetical protein BDR07DRAFT_1382250 [Suillus spraguei]|nr:hypothetical protein BDR07DRAFT_1382250 [Suillus spraguei]